MKDDLISRQGVIEVLSQYPFEKAVNCISIIEELPSAQPEQIARDIATIIENEQDMRVILKDAEHTETHSCDYERTETHDLISRQAAIRWVKIECNPYGKPTLDFESGKKVIAYLERLPSAQPQRWIPVSEALPEDLEAVNITWVNHEPEPYYHDIKDKNFVATGIHYRDKWYWYSTTCADFLGEYGSNEVDEVDDAVEIIAWMPLPEPYKESEE